MKKTILFISILWSCLTQAQTFSNIYYSSTMGYDGAPTAYLNNDTLFTTANIQNVFTKLTYRSFSRQGLLLDSTEYALDTTIYYPWNKKNTLTKVSPLLYVALHDIYIDLDTSQVNVFLFNNQLDTLKTKKVEIVGVNNTLAFDVMADGIGFTILGVNANSNRQFDLFIAHYDLNLNLIWHNVIPDFRNVSNQYFNGYTPQNFIKKDGFYYVTGHARYVTQFVEEFVVKLDSFGNKIWDKRYQYQGLNSGSWGLLDLKGDSIFRNHIPSVNVIGNTDYHKVQFIISDTAHTVIKDSLYPEETIQFEMENSILTQDGNILMVGHYVWGGMKSVVWKIDKNLNTLWRRVYYHGDWEDDSWLYKIAEWSDGGIIATGTHFDKNMPATNQYVFLWLLSLDANGCLDPNNCGSGIGYKEWTLDQDAVKVFPNPAKDFTNVQLPPNAHKAVLRIYNLTGELLLKQDLSQNESRIDLESLQLSPQTVLVEIDAEGKVYYRKVVVQD